MPDDTVDGGSVTAGTLALSEGECDAAWVYADAPTETVALIVPGDSITKDCTFDITATGDNLEAELTTPETVDITSAPDAPSLVAEVDATYLGEGDTALPATITEANDGATVTATITVTFPFGTDEDGTPIVNGNDTQGITASLDELTVTLEQS